MGQSAKVYDVGQVIRLLQVKPHVLRYWEQSIPLVRPRHLDNGRRVWSAAQVRMLLKVRHLVVERRLSVGAAGEELLTRAQPRTVESRAHVEELRARLVGLLLRSRSEQGEQRRLIGENEGENGRPSCDPARDYLGSHSLSLQEVLSWRYRSKVVTDRTPEIGGVSETESEPPDIPTHRAVIPVSHLFSCASHTRTAGALRALLEHRLAADWEDRTLVVPVPKAGIEHYREVLGAHVERENVFLLPIDSFESARARWWAPRLGLLVALGSDGAFQRWCDTRGIGYLHLWAPDDRSVDADGMAELYREALRSQTGISVSVDQWGEARESVVIACERWRARWEHLLPMGRWRGAAHQEGRFSPRSALPRETFGKRYEIWLSDLLPHARRVVQSVSHASAVRPWRGVHWCNEVRLVWPEAFRDERGAGE